MANRSKVMIVARREFLSTVLKKSYLILTFGMPFFVALYIGVFAVIPAMLMEKREKKARVVGVVDLTGDQLVRFEGRSSIDDAVDQAEAMMESFGRSSAQASAALSFIAGNVEFLKFETEDDALDALRAEEIARYYVVAREWLDSGAVRLVVGRAESLLSGASGIGERMREHLRESVLTWGDVDERIQVRVDDPFDDDAFEELALQDDGTLGPRDKKQKLVEIFAPLAFGILLLVALMFTSGYLLQGVAEEKENRVIEVILSSVTPSELLIGKVLGLGTAGMIQLAVWSSVGIITALLTALVAAPDFGLLFLCFVFFLMGYLTVGTLMAGSGSLGNTLKESQQMATIWSLLTVLPPMVTWMFITDEPLGTLARVLSYIPITAPITMMMRLGAAGPPWRDDGIPWWDLGLSLGCLMLGTWLGIRLGAKLFRLGVLMTGKKPRLRVLWRMLRAA